MHILKIKLAFLLSELRIFHYQQMSNSVSGTTVQLKRADDSDDFDSALMTSVFATDLGH